MMVYIVLEHNAAFPPFTPHVFTSKTQRDEFAAKFTKSQVVSSYDVEVKKRPYSKKEQEEADLAERVAQSHAPLTGLES